MSQARHFGCPSCGGDLTVRGAEMQVRCPYCGRAVIVPEELRAQPRRPTPEVAAPAAPATEYARRGISVAPVVTALLVIGLALFVINGLGLFDDLSGGEAPVAPMNRALEGTLPRQTTYAGLQFNVTGATISNQVPHPFGDSPEYSRDQAYAYLDVTVSNPTFDSIYVDSGLAQLRLSDRVYKEDGGWADIADAQSTKEARWVFAVPFDSTWTRAELILAQPGKEPAKLPLEGSVPAPEYPIRLSPGGQATAQEVTYQILSAVLDLDAVGNRADVGKRFLKLQMRFTNNSPFAGGFALAPNDFRLIVDGSPLAPIEAPIEVLAAQSVLEGEVIFDTPASASEVALQVGEVGRGDMALIPIDLPPLP